LARNLKLTLAYDGHDFAGWQIQPDRPTIQGTLVSVIEQLTGEKILPQGSGRTDAGVHALAQTATVTLDSPIPAANFGRALNDVLPQAIRILAVEEMPPDFHARRSAFAKTYRYRIYRGDICSPFMARYVYHHPYPLDESRMVEAAALVEGEHDFTSFAAVDPERNKEGLEINNVRSIFQSQWQRQGEELIYTVRGSGFLHHMVRNLVGTLIEMGRGNLSHTKLPRKSGATVPSKGLTMVSVEYPRCDTVTASLQDGNATLNP